LVGRLNHPTAFADVGHCTGDGVALPGARSAIRKSSVLTVHLAERDGYSAQLSLAANLIQPLRQLADLFGLLGVEIVQLREVRTQVVELAGKAVPSVALGLVEPLGNPGDGPGFRRDQDPVAVAERIAVGVGVVDERRAFARTFALEEPKLV